MECLLLCRWVYILLYSLSRLWKLTAVLPTIWVETVKFHCPTHAITHRWFHRLLLKNDHHCQSCTGCCHCFLLTLFFLRHLSNVILYLSRNIYWHLPSETTQAKCCYTDWWLRSKVLYMSSYCKNWILQSQFFNFPACRNNLYDASTCLSMDFSSSSGYWKIYEVFLLYS